MMMNRGASIVLSAAEQREEQVKISLKFFPPRGRGRETQYVNAYESMYDRRA